MCSTSHSLPYQLCVVSQLHLEQKPNVNGTSKRMAWKQIVNYWLARLTCSVCLCALLIWSQGNDKACRISTTTHVDRGVMICKSAPLFYFALFLCSVSFFQYIAKPGYVRDLGILNLFSRELFGILIYWFSTCIMNIPPQNTVSKEIIKKKLEVRWI